MTNYISDFLMATVNLPDMTEKQLAAQQLIAIQDQFGSWDESRHLRIMVLMSQNPVTGRCDWKSFVPSIIKDWSEKHVFPWIGYPTKVVALIAQPGADAKMHIDCSQQDIGSKQHRFRLMLQGNTSDIYFTTNSGQVHAPEVTEPFVMDVGYPHSMKNTYAENTVLLAYGLPWSGKDSYDPEQVNVCISKLDYGLPTDMEQYLVANH
jgi:hypothetical protein